MTGADIGAGASADLPSALLAQFIEFKERARADAEGELSSRGFAQRSDGSWMGKLSLPNGQLIAATVNIPAEFPDVLPSVVIDRSKLERRVPHVERSGKVCAAPTTGVLIDATRPKDLVSETLKRAADTLANGLAGNQDDDLLLEFQSYWPVGNAKRTYSIISPTHTARAVVRGETVGGLSHRSILFADAGDVGSRWMEQIGGNIDQLEIAFYIPLETPILPPDFDKKLSIRTLSRIVEQNCSSDNASAFVAWLKATSLPVSVLIAVPTSEDDVAIVEARIERPGKDAREKAQAGFRPRNVPPHRRIAFALNDAVTRVSVDRVDPAYLIERGGEEPSLWNKRVAIIGLGAIGSPLAAAVTSLGIGELRLIDPDCLRPENVYRHSLGVRNLEQNKAKSMATALGARFPHVSFIARNASAQDVLRDDPTFLQETNLILIAIGDETIELRLNDLLRDGPPRIHVWVEPLGVGGHSLACGSQNEKQGCYACLFKRDSRYGLTNAAALTAPGQEINRSLAGCAGTFSPFSSLDSSKTAIDAAFIASSVLHGNLTNSALVSWKGDESTFLAAGFRLSERGKMLKSGSSVSISGREFKRKDCNVCGHPTR